MEGLGVPNHRRRRMNRHNAALAVASLAVASLAESGRAVVTVASPTSLDWTPKKRFLVLGT